MTLDGLVGTWVHSHEEDRGDVQVYRTAAFPFPPARGRTSFTLRAGGDASTGLPGPDDRGTSTAGTWTLDGSVLSIRSPEWTATYEVLAADADHLELRPA